LVGDQLVFDGPYSADRKNGGMVVLVSSRPGLCILQVGVLLFAGEERASAFGAGKANAAIRIGHIRQKEGR